MRNVAAALAALRGALGWIRRAAGQEPTHARLTREAGPRTWDEDGQRWATPPAAPDSGPGTNLADHDACELMWAMPARHPGLARLRWAVRDNQQNKGDQ